jgi:hypothetical protein
VLRIYGYVSYDGDADYGDAFVVSDSRLCVLGYFFGSVYLRNIVLLLRFRYVADKQVVSADGFGGVIPAGVLLH